jgi:protein-disulfide isomerase
MRTYFQGQLRLPVSARDHIRGPEKAPITLLEYGDYQCPFCGEAAPVVHEVQRRLGDRLRFVFRNFPLTEMHPYAEHAAEAAEASAAHGKFWEMHDLLYTNQGALDDSHLVRYGTALDLPPSEIQTALTAHLYVDRIREDFMSGVRSGVNGTPTFFINGRRHDGAFDLNSLLDALSHTGGQSR